TEVDVRAAHPFQVRFEVLAGVQIGQLLAGVDQVRQLVQDVVTGDGRDRRGEPEFARDVACRPRACFGVHTTGVGDDLDPVLGARRQDALQLRDEVRRVSPGCVPCPHLLQDAHGHFGQEVHREVVDPATTDELIGPACGIPPEPLAVADGHGLVPPRHASPPELVNQYSLRYTHHGADGQRDVTDTVQRQRYSSRSLYFMTLPPTVSGSPSVNTTAFGVSNPASRSRAYAISSSSVSVPGSFSTTMAVTCSPQVSWGTPITAALSTAGCMARTDSTRIVETFSPPDFTMSL